METLNLTHLYPEKLNIYGDIGNIIAFKKRAQWRDIKLTVRDYRIGDMLPEDTDIYFIGGGENKEQSEVQEDLFRIGDKLKDDVENGVVMLAICGGYQLMGKYFLTGDGQMIKGLGILDIETKAPGSEVSERCIGNVIIRLPDPIKRETGFDTLVGFENHSGQTYLGKNAVPLAAVLSGNGNNLKDKTEGAQYKNVFGTYLHGSLLPKNPHFADYLLKLALKRKYGKDVLLTPLDDKEEIVAHRKVIDKYLVN